MLRPLVPQHYLLLKALSDAGVNPSSMKILDLRPADIAAAWARGDIDAAWYWEPNLDKAVKRGGEIFITSGDMEKRGYPTWDVGVVMNSFAKSILTMSLNSSKQNVLVLTIGSKTQRKQPKLLQKSCHCLSLMPLA